ncbi:hypothetical protein PBI_LUNAR_69 [Arthrobacter phage Lunar]|uniref:Uncharacterized protein n=1 Tax=Arthrobacter phage Lunar TaxID=2419960 RepID=A0A3G2KHP7_9CAUD|nr:hypothetical protein PBI_LUNAR_69 [Arthrobacter phage Lunar]
MRAWLCRRGWHGWGTTAWFEGWRLRVHKSCCRPGCGVEVVR